MKEIDGLEIDNDVKRRTADMIVEQTRMNIKSTMQSILESQSRVTVNEEQKSLIGKTIEDLTSQIDTRKGQLEINEKEVIEAYRDWETIEDLTSQIETRKGQLEINEKDVIGKLDVMREQLGLEKIKIDIEKDRLMVDTVLGLMEAEKIMKEIEGLEVDNEVKRRTADMVVEQTRMNIKATMQSILESQSRVTINEAQKTLIGKTVEDLTSQIQTRKEQVEINALS